MTETMEVLQERATFLRRRINELRIDHPESADARRYELDAVEDKIAAIRESPIPHTNLDRGQS